MSGGTRAKTRTVGTARSYRSLVERSVIVDLPRAWHGAAVARCSSDELPRACPSGGSAGFRCTLSRVSIDLHQLRTTTLARVWFGLTALVVGVGIVGQLFATADVENGRFAALHSRLFDVVCFFTVLSNIIVGVTCLLLALHLDRRSSVSHWSGGRS